MIIFNSNTLATKFITIFLLLFVSQSRNKSFALLFTSKQQQQQQVIYNANNINQHQPQQQPPPLVNCWEHKQQLLDTTMTTTTTNLNHLNRRKALSLLSLLTPATTLIQPAFAEQEPAGGGIITTIQIPNPSSAKLGLQLSDTTIGSPPRPVVAIQSVSMNSIAFRQNVQPGMIVLDYQYSRDVVDRIKKGPYPIELRIKNLAAAGDAIGDLGRPLVSAEDALRAAEQVSAEDRIAALVSKSEGSKTTTTTTEGGFTARVVKQAEGKCAIQSRRGDVMEIKYIAKIGSKDGPTYDSTKNRGLSSYAYQLGNGDVIPGVDLGTYDMCPGEVRELDIPPQLGYGARGSKLYGIGGGERLWWKIELVSLNFIREGENERGRDEVYDGGSGSLPTY